MKTFKYRRSGNIFLRCPTIECRCVSMPLTMKAPYDNPRITSLLGMLSVLSWQPTGLKTSTPRPQLGIAGVASSELDRSGGKDAISYTRPVPVWEWEPPNPAHQKSPTGSMSRISRRMLGAASRDRRNSRKPI